VNPPQKALREGNCTRFFDSSTRAMSMTPGKFVIRAVVGGAIWGSSEAHGILSLPTKTDAPANWSSCVHLEDIPTLEDSHSKALKLGGVHCCTVRVKLKGSKVADCAWASDAMHCDWCNNRCGLVISTVIPLHEEVLA
jgi:hypothetical protein